MYIVQTSRWVGTDVDKLKHSLYACSIGGVLGFLKIDENQVVRGPTTHKSIAEKTYGQQKKEWN